MVLQFRLSLSRCIMSFKTPGINRKHTICDGSRGCDTIFLAYEIIIIYLTVSLVLIILTISSFRDIWNCPKKKIFLVVFFLLSTQDLIRRTSDKSGYNLPLLVTNNKAHYHWRLCKLATKKFWSRILRFNNGLFEQGLQQWMNDCME